MLDFLITKIQNYEDPKLHSINQGEYYIDYLDQGILMSGPGSVVLFASDGKIFRLGNRVNIDDWNMHCSLYENVVKDSTVRMEIPLFRDVVKGMDYTIIQRPNKQQGTNFIDEIYQNSIDQKYFIDYVDQVSDMLYYVTPLVKKYELGYPTDLLAPFKRNKDDIGYFWIDFKRWNLTASGFYEKKIRTLYLILLSLKNINPLPIMTKAEQAWGDILK
jgi:hypothetical protein